MFPTPRLNWSLSKILTKSESTRTLLGGTGSTWFLSPKPLEGSGEIWFKLAPCSVSSKVVQSRNININIVQGTLILNRIESNRSSRNFNNNNNNNDISNKEYWKFVRLNCINNTIDYSWLNKSIDTFKIQCKLTFLA